MELESRFIGRTLCLPDGIGAISPGGAMVELEAFVGLKIHVAAVRVFPSAPCISKFRSGSCQNHAVEIPLRVSTCEGVRRVKRTRIFLQTAS